MWTVRSMEPRAWRPEASICWRSGRTSSGRSAPITWAACASTTMPDTSWATKSWRSPASWRRWLRRASCTARILRVSRVRSLPPVAAAAMEPSAKNELCAAASITVGGSWSRRSAVDARAPRAVQSTKACRVPAYRATRQTSSRSPVISTRVATPVAVSRVGGSPNRVPRAELTATTVAATGMIRSLVCRAATASAPSTATIMGRAARQPADGPASRPAGTTQNARTAQTGTTARSRRRPRARVPVFVPIARILRTRQFPVPVPVSVSVLFLFLFLFTFLFAFPFFPSVRGGRNPELPVHDAIFFNSPSIASPSPRAVQPEG